jgi:hypothetical protein
LAYTAQLLVLVQIGWFVAQYRAVPREIAWIAAVPAVFLLCHLTAPDCVHDKYAVQNLLAGKRR